MKTEDDPEGTPFEVPLCDRAIAILRAVIPKSARPEAYVFAGQWSPAHTKPLGINAVLHALKAVYPAMTTHGCRSSFRDWAGDKPASTATLPKWLWLTRSAVSGAGLSARQCVEERRQLMDAWGRYVTSGSNVIALPRHASVWLPFGWAVRCARVACRIPWLQSCEPDGTKPRVLSLGRLP